MADLLPCPFCGSQGWLHSDGGIFASGPAHRIECEGTCHAMTCYWHTVDGAAVAWNRRAQPAPPEPLPEDVEALAHRLTVISAESFQANQDAALAMARLVLADRQRAVEAEREAIAQMAMDQARTDAELRGDQYAPRPQALAFFARDVRARGAAQERV